MSLNLSEAYEFSGFRLNVPERLLTKMGKAVPLSEKAFETLCALVRRGGSLATKDELISEVWPDAVVEANNLDKSISRLRRILGEKRGENVFIETVRGHGYRLVAEVKRIDHGAVNQKTSLLPSNSYESDSGSLKGRRNPLIESDSVAVMAFENLSSEFDNEYFCDGLAEALINALSKVSGLRVAARTSTFFFNGKNLRLREIGNALGVHSILEGSVGKTGDRIRITVRLVNADNGFTIWAERFDRELRDIFDLQDEIAIAVVDGLKLKLVGSERVAILKRYTTNAEAYLLYLKGQYHRWKTSRSDFASSLKFFRQAVELDPEFDLGNFGISAYYGYGTAWGQLAILPEKAWPLATEYAERAGKIDPTLPELRLSQAARDLVNGRNWESAGRGFASVVDTSSNFAEIHHALSFYFLTLSRFDESVREARRAVELDPLSLLFNRFVGFTLFCGRRYDDAVSQLKETLEMEPNNSSVNELLGAAYIQKGMFAEAVES